MQILDDINASLKQALKDKNETVTSTLRMLRSALHNKEIELRTSKKELSDADVLTVIRREMKQRQDAIEQYTAGGRPELADKEKSEITVLEKYLPAQMTDEALVEIVKSVITETGAQGKKDFGKVMGATVKKVAGAADGSRVKAAVEKALS